LQELNLVSHFSHVSTKFWLLGRLTNNF
jgi:hypothetical protein